MQVAARRTKLKDFGEGIAAAVHNYSTVREIGLRMSGIVYSPFGRLLVQESLIKRMETRLLFVQYLKNHPSITTVVLRKPVWIIGIPRTGTTLLHELMSLHYFTRVHYTWEQIDPVPTTDDESLSALTRNRKTMHDSNKRKFSMMVEPLFSNISNVHRIDFEAPEECTTPASFDLPWVMQEIPFYMFGASQIIPSGAGSTFQNYRKYLQLLTWQAEGRRDQNFCWLLKCPFFLAYMDELIEEFPGASIIRVHRDPVVCIASACSLYRTILESFVEENSIDCHALGAAVLDYTRVALDKAEADIKVCKVQYGSLLI